MLKDREAVLGFDLGLTCHKGKPPRFTFLMHACPGSCQRLGSPATKTAESGQVSENKKSNMLGNA